MDKEEIKNIIKDLVEKVALGEAQVSVNENNGANTWFSVSISEPHHFTMKEGEALYALNHIVRRIIEKKDDEKLGEFTNNRRENSISVDINDFQKRKVESVRTIAHMMGERARYFKSNIEVDPMSAFERKVIHEFFSDSTDLKTESMGFGPSRRVVIKYIGNL